MATDAVDAASDAPVDQVSEGAASGPSSEEMEVAEQKQTMPASTRGRNDYDEPASLAFGELTISAFAALLCSFQSLGKEDRPSPESKQPSLSLFLKPCRGNAKQRLAASAEVVVSFSSLRLGDPPPPLVSRERSKKQRAAEDLAVLARSRLTARAEAASNMARVLEVTRADLDMNNFPLILLGNLRGSFVTLVDQHLVALFEPKEEREDGGSKAELPRLRTKAAVTSYKVLPSSDTDENSFDCSFDSSLGPKPEEGSTTTVLPLVLDFFIDAAIDSSDTQGRLIPLKIRAPGTITGTFEKLAHSKGSMPLPDRVDVKIDTTALLKGMMLQSRCLSAVGRSRRALGAHKQDEGNEVEVVQKTSAKRRNEERMKAFLPNLAAPPQNPMQVSDYSFGSPAFAMKKRKVYHGFMPPVSNAPPALWQWAPCPFSSEKQLVVQEYFSASAVPLLAWYLGFDRIGTLHSLFCIILHTILMAHTSWGPETSASRLPWGTISPELHTTLEILTLTGPLGICMSLFPQHYGGLPVWAGIVWVLLTSFGPLAITYRTEDFLARARAKKERQEAAEEKALKKARDACNDIDESSGGREAEDYGVVNFGGGDSAEAYRKVYDDQQQAIRLLRSQGLQKANSEEPVDAHPKSD